MTKEKSNHYVIVDGYGFVFRAYHSLPPLTRADGTPVGAVLGFTNMLLKLVQEHGAGHIIVVLDAGAKTFRNEIYEQYKANRPPAPEDLIPQFPLVRQAVEAMNLAAIDKVGYEADDIIATYARMAQEQGSEVTIVSSDKDLMQLVGDNICMYDAMKSRYVKEKEVEEKFGVPPNKVLDVLSLMGDSSDNVPGVPGIGAKTAAQLINDFGSLENVLQGAHTIKQQKRRENLIAHAEGARLSKKLITLDSAVPDIPALDILEDRALDTSKLLEFIRENNFKTLEARVQKLFGHLDMPPMAPVDEQEQKEILTEDIKPKNIILCTSTDQLQAFTQKISETRRLGIYLIQEQKKVVGLTLAVSPSDILYIPVVQGDYTGQQQVSLFDEVPSSGSNAPQEGLTFKQCAEILKALLSNRSIIKIGHNIKEIIKLFNVEDSFIHPVDDVMVMSYAVAAGQYSHDMQNIAERYLGTLLPDIDSLKGKGKDAKLLSEIEAKVLSEVAGEYISTIMQLHTSLQQYIFQAKANTVYQTLDRPFIHVLASIESEGIKVDPAILQNLSQEFEGRLHALEEVIHKMAGREFNIGSPKQLGEVLFDEMALFMGDKKIKKSKTGAYSTGADILQELAAFGHEIAEKILEWRQLSKLKSTYTDALVKQINSNTGRIHTHFSMSSTSTGRLSSSDPNLQNIPIRTEEGYKIREAFIAQQGHKLISADYSQIELRLIAHMANLSSLQAAFKEGKDIHATTASEIFGVPIEGMDPLIRRKAKAINFGIIYGISAFGLARQLGISRGEAASYIEQYFEKYPGIRAYMEQTKEFARVHGYVTTLYGRKCFVNGINDKNGARRSFAERAAINAPLQGTAADIIKKAMIQLHKILAEKKVKAKIILQVHDELLIEAPMDEVGLVSGLVKDVMEKVIMLDVPLIVETGSGDNWREIH